MTFLSLPKFDSTANDKNYLLLLLGVVATLSGDWFAQIAFFSVILQLTGAHAPIAIYFLCLFLPKLITPYLWTRLRIAFPWKSVLIFTQMLGGLLTAFQIFAIVCHFNKIFYIVTFAKGFSSALVYLTYDALMLLHLDNAVNINKANATMTLTRYGSLALFPLIGAMCAAAFGNLIAIAIDGLSFVLAAIIFSLVSGCFFIETRNKQPISNSKAVSLLNAYNKLNGFLKIQFGTVFANAIAYSFFNYLLPIYIFVQLSASKQEYGIITSLSGVVFIIGSRFLSSNLMSKISHSLRIHLIIVFTITNGLFLYWAFNAVSILVFLIFLLAACFASLGSIVNLKTSIFVQRPDQRKNYVALYGIADWGGLSLGFLFCAFWGDRIDNALLAQIILFLLSIGPIMLALHQHVFVKIKRAKNEMAI